MRARLASAILREPPISYPILPFSHSPAILVEWEIPDATKARPSPGSHLLTDSGGKFHAGQALPNRAGCRSLTGWGSLPHLSTCCFGSRDRSEIAGAPPRYLGVSPTTTSRTAGGAHAQRGHRKKDYDGRRRERERESLQMSAGNPGLHQPIYAQTQSSRLAPSALGSPGCRSLPTNLGPNGSDHSLSDPVNYSYPLGCAPPP